jgi:hypothetical protein
MGVRHFFLKIGTDAVNELGEMCRFIVSQISSEKL